MLITSIIVALIVTTTLFGVGAVSRLLYCNCNHVNPFILLHQIISLITNLLHYYFNRYLVKIHSNNFVVVVLMMMYNIYNQIVVDYLVGFGRLIFLVQMLTSPSIVPMN